MAQEEICIGIDLGTTFSSIAIYDSNIKKPVLLKNPEGKESTPSWVSFSDMEKSGTIVGEGAKNDLKADCVLHDVKRIIGRRYDKILEEDKNCWGFDVYDDKTPYITCKTSLSSDELERFEPEEISGIILSYLRNIYRNKYDSKIGNIVVTVPADFNENQRRATLTACKLAGLENVELINEPTAAILEYKRLHPDDISDGSTILVIDFGGGTLDINCCEMEKNKVKVLSTYGDQNLGGNNFDLMMMDIIKEALYDNCVIESDDYFKVPPRALPRKIQIVRARRNRLRKEAERVKIELSTKHEVDINGDNLFTEDDVIDEDSLASGVTITRKDFEAKCEPLLEGLKKGIKKVCRDANKSANDIDLVLLIGGTCKIQMVKNKISSMFTNEKIAKEDFDSMTAVAMGAAYYSYSEGNKNSKRVEISDKMTRSVGIEITGGEFLPIYPKSEHLGQTISREVTASEQKQKECSFNIYFGDQEYIESDGMIYLTNLKISNIPQYEGIKTPISIEMSVDKSGLLKVSAKSVPVNCGENQRLKDENNDEFKEVKGEISCNIDLRPVDDKYDNIKNHFDNFLPHLF